MNQAASGICECLSKTVITPTISPHEFTWTCPRCHRAGVISWAHVAEPPTYRNAALPLFEAK